MDNFIDVSNIMVNALEEHEVLSASGDNSMLGNMTNQEWWSEQSGEIKKFIEENDKVFFCEWEGYLGEIHSVETMYHQYKESNLFPNTLLGYMTESRNGGKLDDDEYSNENFGNYEDFVQLVKYTPVGQVNEEMNMMIVRLKWM